MKAGDLCPKCKEGHLYPKFRSNSGAVNITPNEDKVESSSKPGAPDITIDNGKIKESSKTYVCDKCGNEINDIEVEVKDNINL